jgi:plasmid stabilization system protein ParE
MKVRYSREAIADLIGIADYIREHNPRAAEAVEKRIRASIDQLETFPLIGRPTDDPGFVCFPSCAIRTSYSMKWWAVR